MPDRDARARAIAKKLVFHCDHLLEPIIGACADCITTALVAFAGEESKSRANVMAAAICGYCAGTRIMSGMYSVGAIEPVRRVLRTEFIPSRDESVERPYWVHRVTLVNYPKPGQSDAYDHDCHARDILEAALRSDAP